MSDELEPVMNEDHARALTSRIREALQVTWALVLEAYQGRAWEALGYDTWDAYTREEFGTDRMRLPRIERREAVEALRQAGMSTRAIASGLGVDAKTVRNDLAGGEISPPERVTGTDGKDYAPTRYAEARRLLRAAAKARAAAEEAERAAEAVRGWMPEFTTKQREALFESDVEIDGGVFRATVLRPHGGSSAYHDGRHVRIVKHTAARVVVIPEGGGEAYRVKPADLEPPRGGPAG